MPFSWEQTVDFEEGDLSDLDTVSSSAYDQVVDLEEGDLSDFTSTVGSGLSANNTTPIDGDYDLEVDITSSAARYGVLGSALNHTEEYCSFQFNADGLTMADGDLFFIALARGGAANCFRLDLYNNGGSLEVRIVAFLNSGNNASSFFSISGTTRVEIKFAQSSGTDDGYVLLYINGVLMQSFVGLANDTIDFDELRVGATGGIDAGTSGKIYFDNIKRKNGAAPSSAESYAAESGSYGGVIRILNENASYWDLEGPSSEDEITLELECNPKSLPMDSGDVFTIVRLVGNGSGGAALDLELKWDGSNYQVRLGMYNDLGSATWSSYYNLTDDTFNKLRILWGAVANAGWGEIYIEDVLQEAVTGIDNNGHDIDTVRVGAIANIDAGTGGLLDFDMIRWATEARRPIAYITGILAEGDIVLPDTEGSVLLPTLEADIVVPTLEGSVILE